MASSQFASRPECFSADEWKEWKRLAVIAPPPIKHGYCNDCLPGYQKEMIGSGNCRYPNVTFLTSGEGIVGKRGE